MTPALTLPRVAAVVPVRARHDHLVRCLDAVLSGSRPVDLVVVVAIDDELASGHPDLAALLGDRRVTVRHLRLGPPLAVAAARNLGAETAIGLGADVLVMLDVDLIAGIDLVAAYEAACVADPGAVWSGPVTYLGPEHAGLSPRSLAALDAPHPARPAPPPGVRVPLEDPDLFWSLSFALTATAWRQVGGFHEAYRGYGAEDTDFSRLALEAGLRLVWEGSARGFHQWHPSEDPPVRHLEDILRNGAIYASRWGRWPMRGWLDAFVSRGLIKHDGADRYRLAADPTPEGRIC